ncbi:dTTP/UTP pyrophosphatase [Penicillium verhagenii]|uniref:dTTP/UTP pyrophosphatase n=1 Tax=Penicillium verhagenii TaxID=1562060 RepID=UPI0025453854|nr:dTTP/UTP pyrophosphatase [Penicillium verhagenii]KAJ5948204.1 dTTP/UTP pyrophosphatase [Penicillium verhagenii]
MNVNKWKFIINYGPRKSAANQRMISVGKTLVHDEHRDPQSSKTQLQQPSTPPNPQATTMANSKADLLDFEDSNDSPPAYDPSTKPTPAPSRGALPRPPPLSLPALNALRSKRVILASQSPRRRQIISFLGLPNLEIIPSNADEDLPKSLGAVQYVLETATKKAQAVYTQEIDNEVKGEPALILAADTIVVDVTTDAILEKPRSESHHFSMLRALRDARDHKVYTALVAMAPLASARQPGYAIETVVEETNVRFDGDVTDDLLMAYVRTREGADKAGGYGLQGLGSILIEKIEGSYDNVIGLPLKATLKLIETVMQKANDEDRLEGDPLLEEDEDQDE